MTLPKTPSKADILYLASFLDDPRQREALEVYCERGKYVDVANRLEVSTSRAIAIFQKALRAARGMSVKARVAALTTDELGGLVGNTQLIRKLKTKIESDMMMLEREQSKTVTIRRFLNSLTPS